MSSTSLVYDVVVIGGGISGLVTAVRAAQLNLCVVVLEQSIDEEYMCNSRLTSGVFHCALNPPSDSIQNLFSKIKKDTNEFASEELAELISQNALSVIRWLQTLGVRFIKGAQSYYEFILSPPTLHHQKEGWRNKGGDNLLKRLEGHLLKAGSCIKRGHRTINIKARVGNQFEVFCQVPVGKEISIKTKNVVIADGGFQNNIELISESITPSPDKVFQRNGRSAYGDGILLSRSLGGDVTGLDGFYGHLLSIDCFVNDALWPNPWLDAIASSGILVTKEGIRFADEGNGGIFLANQVAKLEDPLSCFAIADEKIWTDRGNLTMQGPNPKLIESGGTYYVGATIQELAVRANINESNLSKTVCKYNNSIEKNEVHLLTPIRTRNKGPYFPIMRPPYYAFPVCAGITYTMGGIKTNQFMQVISVTDEPIRGLFAVGACTGGLEGGTNIGYVGGLIKSSVMGFKAADFIAQNTHQNNL